MLDRNKMFKKNIFLIFEIIYGLLGFYFVWKMIDICDFKIYKKILYYLRFDNMKLIDFFYRDCGWFNMFVNIRNWFCKILVVMFGGVGDLLIVYKVNVRISVGYVICIFNI